MVSCAGDFACFLEMMDADCTPASVRVSEAGVGVLLEIIGKESNGTCRISARVSNMEKTGEVSEETWGKMDSLKPSLSMRDAVCSINARELREIYEEKGASVSGGGFENCEGTFGVISALLAEEKGNGKLSLEAQALPSEIKTSEAAALAGKAKGGSEPYVFEFDFGDGSKTVSNESVVVHRYYNELSVQRMFVATVRVVDSKNNSASAKAAIAVNSAERAVFRQECAKSSGARGKVRITFEDGSVQEHLDYCLEKDLLVAHSCENGTVSSANISCASRCIGGACVS